MNPFFQSIADANRAHCAAHGFSTAELYGTPPNADEFEVHDLIEAGVPAEAAGMFSQDRMEAERLRLRKLVVRQQRDIRLRNRGYAEGNFKRLVNVESFINRRAAQ